MRYQMWKAGGACEENAKRRLARVRRFTAGGGRSRGRALSCSVRRVSAMAIGGDGACTKSGRTFFSTCRTVAESPRALQHRSVSACPPETPFASSCEAIGSSGAIGWPKLAHVRTASSHATQTADAVRRRDGVLLVANPVTKLALRPKQNKSRHTRKHHKRP